jgi:hypothetical protein
MLRKPWYLAQYSALWSSLGDAHADVIAEAIATNLMPSLTTHVNLRTLWSFWRQFPKSINKMINSAGSLFLPSALAQVVYGTLVVTINNQWPRCCEFFRTPVRAQLEIYVRERQDEIWVIDTSYPSLLLRRCKSFGRILLPKCFFPGVTDYVVKLEVIGRNYEVPDSDCRKLA